MGTERLLMGRVEEPVGVSRLDMGESTMNDWIVISIENSNIDLIIIDLPSLHMRLANREPSAYELWMALFAVYSKMEGKEYFEDGDKRWHAFKINWSRSIGGGE